MVVKMAQFSGNVHLRVLEATDLMPTAFTKRLPGINVSTLNSYVEISIDDQVTGKTTVKGKCLSPIWNEEFSDDVSMPNAKI